MSGKPIPVVIKMTFDLVGGLTKSLDCFGGGGMSGLLRISGVVGVDILKSDQFLVFKSETRFDLLGSGAFLIAPREIEGKVNRKSCQAKQFGLSNGYRKGGHRTSYGVRPTRRAGPERRTQPSQLVEPSAFC